jgi:hypothetical protein
MSNAGKIIPTVFKDGIPLLMTTNSIVIYISMITLNIKSSEIINLLKITEKFKKL